MVYNVGACKQDHLVSFPTHSNLSISPDTNLVIYQENGITYESVLTPFKNIVIIFNI